MNIASIATNIIALLIALIFHEFAHAWMAWKLGDNTAVNYGRLSLNPKDHIDPIGTILLPFILIISHSPVVFGWAKPVPINFLKLKNKKIGMLVISLSGSVMNLLIALILSVFIKMMLLLNIQITFILLFFKVTLIINVYLAFFNFVPIPPLDGYNALMSFLPIDIKLRFKSIEQYGILLLIVFLYFNIIDKIVLIPSRFIINFLM